MDNYESEYTDKEKETYEKICMMYGTEPRYDLPRPVFKVNPQRMHEYFLKTNKIGENPIKKLGGTVYFDLKEGD